MRWSRNARDYTIQALLVTMLVAPGVSVTVVRLRDALSTAERVRALRPDDRRAVCLGDWYPSVQRLRREIPEQANVDIVMVSPAARDIAVLSGAALLPRNCRFFHGWGAWRQRSRANFMDDPRAVNAPPGSPPPPRNGVVVIADPQQRPPLKLVP